VWFAWRTVWDAWPLGSVLFPGAVVAIALLGGPGSAYALKRIVDVSPMPWVLVPVGAMLLTAAGAVVYGPLQNAASHYTRHALRRRLLASSLEARGLEHLENPAHADSVNIVRTRAWATTIVFSHLPSFVGFGLSSVVALGLLWSVQPILVPFAVASLAAGWWQARAARDEFEAIDRNAPDQRLAARIATLAMSAEAAKEVRMLDLGPFLVSEHRALTERSIESVRRARVRRVLSAALAGAVRGVVLVTGILILVVLAAQRSTTPGQAAMGMAVLLSGVQSLYALGGSGAQVTEWAFYSKHLEWLLRYQSPVASPPVPARVLAPLRTGIELDHVSFAYPGTALRVLDDVTLRLAAGTTVAVVGENGAGKTTLVKLLCRFYDPDAGKILVDGTDLRTLDLEAWRGSGTGAFQDFVRLHVTLGEAIGAGDVPHMADGARVGEAAQRAGAGALVASLPHGLETQLGREFPGGVDLSGGQWQLVALARAGMRRRPLLVLLDEPTAALDPRAEHEVFVRFARMSDSARSDGAVTILVSHRFSTVRMADAIVVLDHGRVLEQGTHEQLMAGRGLYAELYALQAGSYE
jgi:ABC-type multidrug transport system fused ATPase/permease subunit